LLSFTWTLVIDTQEGNVTFFSAKLLLYSVLTPKENDTHFCPIFVQIQFFWGLHTFVDRNCLFGFIYVFFCQMLVLQAFLLTWDLACAIENGAMNVPSGYDFLVYPTIFNGSNCSSNIQLQVGVDLFS
jgi:hypothetical protein